LFILNISEVSITVNSKIGKIRDDIDSQIYDLDLWVNGIVTQTKKDSFIRKQRCEVCNSKEDNFEGHHIAGRKHDYRQITACKICHRWLSDRQKNWDKRWENENLSDDLRQAFFLLGLHDMLILKSRKTGISLYENLGYSFTEIISELLKRG
jgi:hypothetical protein